MLTCAAPCDFMPARPAWLFGASACAHQLEGHGDLSRRARGQTKGTYLEHLLADGLVAVGQAVGQEERHKVGEVGGTEQGHGGSQGHGERPAHPPRILELLVAHDAPELVDLGLRQARLVAEEAVEGLHGGTRRGGLRLHRRHKRTAGAVAHARELMHCRSNSRHGKG